jgi:aspartokinase
LIFFQFFNSISVIGRKVAQKLGSVLQLLNELPSPPTVYLISQAASDVNLTLIVDQNEAEKISEVLHDKVLATDAGFFGPSFKELMNQIS